VKRQVLKVPGVEHNAPIPLGVRMGNMIWTSALMGMDPKTGEIPDDPATQVRLLYENLDALLADGGADRSHVGFVSVFLTDNAYRSMVNEYWTAWYPDEDDRPARHTTLGPLPQNVVVQMEVTAILDEDARG
jgi:2-iminobutanoate/2-iminopropanoate deaminase